MSSTSNDPSLSEWQTARAVLNSYDDRLHDLHKVGFSFVTGLLTVDALLANIPDNWKLAALVAALFLIVPLDLVDRNYRVFTTAASIRAQIIERRSLMDLTQTITRMFEIAHVAYFFEIVYVLFALAVLLLGWIIFVPNLPDTYAKLAYWAPVVIFAISTVVAARLELKNLRSGLQKFLIKIAIAILPLSTWLLTPLILSLENSCWLLGVPSATACSMIHGYRTLIISVAISVASILYIETAVNLNEWVDFSIDGYDYKRRKPVLITVGNLGYENRGQELVALWANSLDRISCLCCFRNTEYRPLRPIWSALFGCSGLNRPWFYPS